MRRVVFSMVLLLYFGAAVSAADLSQIDRQIGKLPQLESPEAEYGLLVFGRDSATRVWLVHDGDVLYVDRNGDGDLTEADERVEADPLNSSPGDGVYYFKAGDVLDGHLVHKDLRVYWYKVSFLQDGRPHIRRRLEQNPEFRGCQIDVDVALEGHRGTGIDGRVAHFVDIDDRRGLLEFSRQVEDAPIIHFGGPWEITLRGRNALRMGSRRSVRLVMGTPGIGPGTTALVQYQGVIPSGLKPSLKVVFPSDAGEPISQTYELTRRCCVYQLYDDVVVPEGASTGTANVEVTLDAWPGAHVASTAHEVPVLPPQKGQPIAVVPVSPRLASRLEHRNPAGNTCGIRFSPDGKRLVAGDYPGGVVHVWDVAEGERLTTVELGEGFRATIDYFAVSPDMQTLLAAQNSRRDFDRVEKEGAAQNRVIYDGAVKVWDLKSGAVTRAWRHDPPRYERWIKLSPDGSYFFAQEEVSGTFERYRPRGLSLWDTATGEHRDVIGPHAYVTTISPDGTLAAATIPIAAASPYSEAISVYAMPECEQHCRIALGELEIPQIGAFLDDRKLLAHSVITVKKRDENDRLQSYLKFYRLPSGKEIFSVAAEPVNRIGHIDCLPDGRVLASSRGPNQGQLLLIDWRSESVKRIELPADSFPRKPALHPSGKWAAVPMQVRPKQLRGRPIIKPAMLPQPHVLILELTTGEILEDLVAPQSIAHSCDFSPDGETLATSGAGEVLLWDFRSPPGKLGAAPQVGQPFEIAGTLVGGEPLDVQALRGKVVLASYWATWCQPCVAELPELRSIYQMYHDQGFEVVGISLDDHGTKLDEFVKTQRIPWPIVCCASADEAGMRHPMAIKYAVDSVPKSFLLDKQGNIAAIDPHARDLPKLIEKLIARKTANQPE